MARTLNASYTVQKNLYEGSAPIRLFEIEYGDVSSSKIWWAAWNEDVDYFLPGTATAQTYTAFPLQLSDLTYSKVDQSPSMTLQISNVDRSIIAYFENNDGLRGRKVTILRVFSELLDNSDAYLSETYYVDGGQSSKTSAKVTLVPKSTIYNITVPRRKYRKNQCMWQFKSEECTGSATGGTPTNATLRSGSGVNSCMKTLGSCDAYNNTRRYGGFPGIPTGRVFFRQYD